MMPKGHVVKPMIDRVTDRIERIPEAGCWIFMGALNEAGYGIVGKGGRGAGNDRAHRITYRHYKGEIPDGMFVCHRCDVPSCCNPDHLFLGTNQDNVRDCWNKGRGSRPPVNDHIKGSAHVGAKLTEQHVIAMRAMQSCGAAEADLAAVFGVSQSTAHRIATGKRWRHVA